MRTNPWLIPHSMALLLLAALPSQCTAFLPPSSSIATGRPAESPSETARWALDPVTYLRTEWVSAALCTNQTPRSADRVLQLGCEDGRVVNFVPRTVREIVTSSAEKKDSPEGGGLTVSCRRQLKQMAERRRSAFVTYSDQPADSLVETPSSSIDVVISLQCAQRMAENGLDWKKSIAEAGRVLKPGGRFLFVESAEVGGESYLEEIMKWSSDGVDGVFQEEEGEDSPTDDEQAPDESESDVPEQNIIFSEVGFDNVDMVLQPHIAGVAIKALDADLTSQQRAEKKSQEEEERLAELSLSAFERGRKKRRKKKTKNGGEKREEMGMKT
eukprot:CCRYP_003355-RA/>CCRYP_003355-RA protein AED:0.04 eAED:0.04 QI:2381/1/1/1/0.5/0.4/5/259/327